MNALTETLPRIALTGVGATVFMDLWLALLRRMGVPTLDFAMIGRWVGHWPEGVWRHAAIAKAQPVRGELPLGWLVHYATGIGFAGLLAVVAGASWIEAPTLLPALATGVATVSMPWLVMQPAMGAGFASAQTPSPWKNRARSLGNHTVFGLGLYVAARLFS